MKKLMLFTLIMLTSSFMKAQFVLNAKDFLNRIDSEEINKESNDD
jgi:hypothetical protein